jgi:hypothetical protein
VGERCVSAKCKPVPSCTAATTVYDLSAGDGELDAGQTFSVEHTFQVGPVSLKLLVRASRTDRWPRIQVMLDSTILGAMPVTSSSVASYEFVLESDGGPHTISVSQDSTGTDPGPHLSLVSLDVEDCSDRQGTCAGGGMFFSESNSCAPFVCDIASDCGDVFPGPAFLGTCQEHSCFYPKCSSLSPTPRSGADVWYRCLSYAELIYSYGYPHVENLQGGADDFECPAVSALTWKVDPFSGEGSCVEGPVCGPDRPSEVGISQDDQNQCCYWIARLCGV